MLDALRVRDFRLLFVGTVASMFGDSAMLIVMGIWVKSITGSNAAAGSTYLLMTLPSLVSPLSGWLVDRVRRRPFLVVTNLASAAIVLLLLLVGPHGPLWLIYLVAFGYGVSWVAISAAMNGLLKEMLPERLLGEANGSLQTVREGLRLVGPLAGAGLFAALGGGSVAVLDAATFVVGAGALSMLRLREPKPEPPQLRVRAELVAGARHLMGAQPLRRVTVTLGVAFLVIGFVETAIYAVVGEGLHRPPSFVGVLVSIQGVGAIIGGLTAARLLRRVGEQALAAIGLLLFGVGDSFFVLGGLPLDVVGITIAGTGLPWVLVAFTTLMQRTTPSRLLGRVSAATDVIIGTPQTVSIGLGAIAISFLDYRLILATVGAVVIGCGAVLLTRRIPLPPPAKVAHPAEREGPASVSVTV